MFPSTGDENSSQKRLVQLAHETQSPSAIVVCYLLFAIQYSSNPLFEWMSAFHSSCLKLSFAVADAGVMG